MRMPMKLILALGLLGIFSFQTYAKESSTKKQKPTVLRGIASVVPSSCADTACLCEEVKKLSQSCLETVDKLFLGSEDANRKTLRSVQGEIAGRRRQIIEQGKSCLAFSQAELCFDRSTKTIVQKNPRTRDIKNENSAELVGFGNDLMIKIGNQPGRTPASK